MAFLLWSSPPGLPRATGGARLGCSRKGGQQMVGSFGAAGRAEQGGAAGSPRPPETPGASSPPVLAWQASPAACAEVTRLGPPAHCKALLQAQLTTHFLHLPLGCEQGLGLLVGSAVQTGPGAGHRGIGESPEETGQGSALQPHPDRCPPWSTAGHGRPGLQPEQAQRRVLASQQCWVSGPWASCCPAVQLSVAVPQ